MELRLKILEETLLKLGKEREKIQSEINNDPTCKLIEIHLDFNNWLKETEETGDRTSKVNIAYIQNLHSKMRENKRRQKIYDSNKLISKLVKIDCEIQEVNNQIYSLKQK